VACAFGQHAARPAASRRSDQISAIGTVSP
jgi:hypothetical protein